MLRSSQAETDLGQDRPEVLGSTPWKWFWIGCTSLALVFILTALPVIAEHDGGDGHDRGEGHRQPRPSAPQVQVPTIFNYRLLGWRREDSKCAYLTFHAWLANPLPVTLENVEATLSTTNPAIKVIEGRLRFELVRQKSEAPSEGTFIIRNESGEPLNFDDLVWTIGLPLSGRPRDLASKALFDLPPVGVDPSQIENGVILTRIDLRISVSASVQEVNAALAKVGGRIVSMSAGDLAMTIAVPRQASLSALRHLADVLSAQPGIGLARPGFEPQPLTFRKDGSTVVDPAFLVSRRFLMPSRFPAAINVGTSRASGGPLLTSAGGCKVDPVTILVPDFFGATVPAGFQSQVPFLPPDTPLATFPDPNSPGAYHGYLVGAIVGAANPYWPCLIVTPIQSAGLTPDQETRALLPLMPPLGEDKFIVTRSLGYTTCATAPDPCEAPDGQIYRPADRAEDALTWKALTRKRWGDFLMINAAGNERNKDGTRIYPGLGEAAYDNHPAIAALTDPLFSFVSDTALWNPLIPLDANGGAFVSLVADSATVAQLTNDVNDAGLAGPDSIPTDVLIVGSSTNEPRSATQTAFVPPEQLTESLFSNSGSDLRAVGEGTFDPGLPPGSDLHAEGFNGTSFATPQVAGLVSYLWLLSNDLRYVQPVEKTRQAILQNVRNQGIDAYATVLSLDQAVLPTTETAPVRLALLDVDGDGLFTEKDIDIFLRFLYFVDGQGNITRQLPTNTQADFSRYDLNGDGFTTASGDHRERFDLDRVGSTQYGTTLYSTVTQMIEGQPIGFDESELTDVEILCYYAYSPLYAGDFDARKSLLDGRCGFSISPKTVTLHPGQSQTFTASSNATFTVSGGGTIDSATGKFTAGNTAGTYTVQATSTTDSSLTAQATVTVQPSSNIFTGTVTWVDNHTGPVTCPGAVGDVVVTTVTANVTLQVASLSTGTGITVLSASGSVSSIDSNNSDANYASLLGPTGSYAFNSTDNNADDQLSVKGQVGSFGQGAHRVFANGQLQEIDFTREVDFACGGGDFFQVKTPYFNSGSVSPPLAGVQTQTGILRPAN